MSDLVAHLRRLRPKLVSRATQALTRGEVLRASVEVEVGRFYDQLADALESGSQEWLHHLVEEWVASRPETTDYERQTFVPLLHTLRSCLWELLSEEAAPAEALLAIVTLERFFAGASLYLSKIEYEARVAEIETTLGVARAELERLDKSKSDFIAVAAHELKTPLALIEGYAQLLNSDLPLDQLPQIEVHLRGIRNGTRRLKEIIEDMLDVSLIDNDLLDLRYQPLRLASLAAQVQHDLQPTLQQRKLQLSLDLFDQALTTHADPVRLVQVFRNILENAVKFTPDGGRITVGSRELPGFVELTIADTGIGIAPEDQERIFAKFGSLDDVSRHSSGKTKFKGGGPGLGLPIARGIVQAHGGTLWVESPGHDEKACPGSTFHIVLPKLDAPPPDKTAKLFKPFPTEQATLHHPAAPA